MNCTHHVCRCARARELLAIYDRTGRAKDLRAAIDIHQQQVECRLPPPAQHVCHVFEDEDTRGLEQ